MRYFIISLTAMLTLITGNLFAQHTDSESCAQSVIRGEQKEEQGRQEKSHRDMKEMIQAKKIAFFTEYLDLTPGEAEKFWPLYNSFWKQRMNAHKEAKVARKNLNKTLNSSEEASDATIKALMERYFSLSKKEFEIMDDMFAKMGSILPVRKTAKLISAEEKFREQLIRQLKEKKD